MAAQVYDPPEGMEVPDFDSFNKEDGGYDVQAYFDACKQHEQDMAEWCRQNSKSDLAGEVMRFPVADGKATYMVHKLKPLTLIFLDYGDGYEIPDMMLRGMTVADVRSEVARNRKLAELFGGR